MDKQNTGSINKQWQPIFEGEEAREIWQVVYQIADALQHPPVSWIPGRSDAIEPFRIARGATMGTGSAGLSLFYAYLARVPDSSHSDTQELFADSADRFLSHACDALDQVTLSLSLYRGLSGIAWTVQHLQAILYCNDNGEPENDPNEEIDRVLLENWKTPEKFDLWEGCTGLGVYALERYPHPEAVKLLELIVTGLEQLSSTVDAGITWFTSPAAHSSSSQIMFSDGYYDTGVAHGVAGVISFLSRVLALGIAPKTTEKLLEGAVSWLLAQQWERGDGSFFPQFILPPDNKPIGSGTFGLCHGDLGIAAALVSAASCLDRPSWTSTAIQIAKASHDHLNHLMKATPVSNPHLCHGASGIGHLYNRIYQATGLQSFKQEACKWFRRTLELRQPGTGIAGYYKYGRSEEGEMTELYDPGFIQGAAGVGLALLAAITDTEPEWDRVMLISAREKKKKKA